MNFIKRLSLTFGLTAILLTSSCSLVKPYKAPITQGTVINQEAIATLQKGLTMGQVRQILGPPFGKDKFNPLYWEYVFYTTQKSFQDDLVEHLTLSFDKENYLKDWEIIKRNTPIMPKR